MASCKGSFVSILNNDDNPSFAVRSAPRITRHQSSPTYPYSSEQPRHAVGLDYRYGNAYSGSPAVSPRVSRQQFDPVSEATQPTSPGSSDCSYDYTTSANTGSYFQHGRQEYPGYSSSAMPAPEKRLSANSMVDPPSPPTSIGGSKDTTAARGTRKNKYPCPFAASHGCSATFTTSGHAARHGKKHTGEKSVHCPICNKAFTRKDNMKQHIRTHRTHSEDMPTGMIDRESEGSSGWRSRRTSPTYSHHRSVSQSQMDGNAYESMTTMNSMTSSGSHRSQPY